MPRIIIPAFAAVLFAVVPPGALRAQHDMTKMGRPSPAAPLSIPDSRRGSGTSWLPDSSAIRMTHLVVGPWALMLHGSASAMYDRQGTLHGGTRWGLLDWEMLTATRAAGDGLLRFSAMTSLESFVLPDTGYPLLLQSGESFRGRRLANVQHPHDLVGELSGGYEHSISNKLSLTLYAAIVGEPALGPVSYRHRPSARVDPFAPLSLHWQDAAHTSAGVVTAGMQSRSVRLEGSLFNGRDADENRRSPDVSGMRLDSYAGRVSVAPGGWMVISAWAGYLADHDPLDRGVGMQRFGASLLTETRGMAGGALSTAVVWGLNNHHHGSRSHDHGGAGVPMTHHLSSSVLAEATLGVGVRTDVFARVEQVQKMSDDLGFLAGNLMETFNVRAIEVGASREIASRGGVALLAGARGAVNLLPETLRYTYTTTHPTGFALFGTLVPVRR